VHGKLCVITGATSGIGLAAAEALARLGARLVLVGRDPLRGERALDRLRARTPGVQAEFRLADLQLIGETRRLGSELASKYPRIDVLINNAGAQFEKRALTEEGLERTFALNHMSYFALTQSLLDTLLASAPSRIVNVSSRAHVGALLDFEDLNLEKDYRGWTAYSRSKLANILFTRELARRLGGTGVTANSLHPGFVASRFGYNNSLPFRIKLFMAKRWAISPAKGAETVVHLASAASLETVSGAYFEKSEPVLPSAAAQDDAIARRLWDMSADIADRAAARRGTSPASR